MPPNLLVRAAFVRGELENVERKDHSDKNGVRTNFILQNIYSYILGEKYCYNAVCAVNDKEVNVLKQLKETVKAFQLNYADTVKSLCTEIEVNEDTVSSVILGVANELFCEGITWSRIIALFVFVGELTILCLSNNLPVHIVDVVYESFSRLVEEQLECWVHDHDGWEGISSLSIAQQENSSKLSNPGWAKSLFYNTVRMIGTVAQIANYKDQVVPSKLF